MKRIYIHLTDEERSDIVRLRQEGLRHKEIADYIGCSCNSVYLVLRKNGLTGIARWNNDLDGRLIEEANKDASRGRGYRLAKMFNQSYTSVMLRMSKLRKMGYDIKYTRVKV